MSARGRWLALALALGPAAPLGAQAPANGRLEGTVTDSVHSGPLVGADVSVRRIDVAEGAARTVVTDKRGAFRFDELAAGRYSVTFVSTLLDSLESGIAPVSATVRPGETARVDLATPSGRPLREAACPGAGLGKYAGALLGMVMNAEDQKPLADAVVTVSWEELAVDSAAKDVATKARVARASTNESGQYRLCGLPTDENLDVQVSYQGAPGPMRSVSVGEAEGVLVRNHAFRVVTVNRQGQPPAARESVLGLSKGSASVVGRVARSDGQPVAGAQVRLLNGTSLVLTDDKGEYSLHGLPDGAQELEVRRLGYSIARRPVVLAGGQALRENVQMERVVTLDSMKVVARRLRFTEFERNRLRFPGGVFLDEDEIARRGFRTLPLMISNIRGFRLSAMTRGRIGIQTTRLRSCQMVGTERMDAINLVVDNMEHVEVAEVNFDEVAAIEAYYDGDKAPVKYQRACSVIVLWTKYIARKSKYDDKLQK